MAVGATAQNDNAIKALALLDTGSNATLCAEGLAKRAGLKGARTTVTVNTLAHETCWNTFMVDMLVEPTRTRKPKKILMKGVMVIDTLPAAMTECAAHESDLIQWSHLPSPEELYMKGSGDAYGGVEIIVGLDQTQALRPLETRRGGDGQPFAVRTALGWTIQGARTTRNVKGTTTSLAALTDLAETNRREGKLEEMVRRFWDIDEPTNKEAMERDEMSGLDRYVVNLWEQQVTREGGHYVLPIPFKSIHGPQVDNWSQARRRLESLRARLKRDRQLGAAYEEEIQKLVGEGYAERVPKGERNEPGNRVWYLPHHPVLNPNKPGKVRVVFDCAAVHQGISLNSQALQGPDLTNNLVGILIRFRQERVALTADIEAMFYQVKVSEKDRDALRFLWRRTDHGDAPIEVYRMKVHVFGGVWSPACAAYALRRTLQEYGNQHPVALGGLAKNFYVDDLLHSVSDEEQAREISAALMQALRKGGFRLTKWASSHPKVLRGVPPIDRISTGGQSGALPTILPEGRALGVVWNQARDEIAVKTEVHVRADTRRGMLGTFSAVYDPLGMVAPFLIRAKMLFQEECRRGKGWDEPLPPETRTAWRRWVEELRQLAAFAIPRHYQDGATGGVGRVELHTFADASQHAYGTVSYLRFVQIGRTVKVAFVLGKSRLAPMKGASIPRLELCAAKLATEMAALIVAELDHDVNETIFWTDSMLVLQYIHSSSRRFKTYVANRVSAIQRSSTADQWRHLSSEHNPADDVSRGLSAHELVSSGRWAMGPEFLRLPPEKWPATPDTMGGNYGDLELRPAVTFATHLAEAPPGPLDKLWSRYSCWNKLKRAVAWLARFARWWGQRKEPDTPGRQGVHIDAGELERAGVRIVRTVQRERFGSTIRALLKGGAITRTNHLFALEPYLDGEGMIRVGGRLSNANINQDARNPYLLPKDHQVTQLIVRHMHRTTAGHMGREHTTASIREKYWIPKIRIMVDKELKRCVKCRRTNWVPRPPRQADLPEDRVTHGGPPFSATGLDCFGPFMVAVGRRREKRWGCLFTCLNIRAIHLETLEKLDAGDLIMALTRFTSRKGTTPRLLRSDNGTNMVRANKDIEDAARSWNDDGHFRKELAERRIRWIFNPPGAPHTGGVWERQIRTVKKTLDAIIGTQQLDDARLRTLFCEVERIVNNRPLTPTPSGPNDLAALTPAHALYAGGDPGPFLGAWDIGDCVRRRWRHAQVLADRFWNRWLREYLPGLRKRQRLTPGRPNLSVGDVVLVTNGASPRNQWPLARVVRVFPGADGVVRRVRVRTSRGTLMRAPVHLCPLEGAVQ